MGRNWIAPRCFLPQRNGGANMVGLNFLAGLDEGKGHFAHKVRDVLATIRSARRVKAGEPGSAIQTGRD